MTRARGFAGPRARGFVLLPVVLALTLLAALAFQLNRESGMSVSLGAHGLQADAARFAAEAGIAQLNRQTQSRNCTGYTDLGATAFGPHSFSATVNPKSGSPVTLVATSATADGAGATLSRANVEVWRTTPLTITLQPKAALDDTHIKQPSPTYNYGADTNLNIQGGQQRMLVKFDLAGIPAGSTVQSAQFSLYKPTSGGASAVGQTMTAHRMTRAWVEGNEEGSVPSTSGATWNTFNSTTAWTTPGGDYDASVGATTDYSSSTGWRTWDITAIAQTWVSGANPNHGLIIVPSSGVPNAQFVSGDDATREEFTPRLVLTLLPPCGWTPLQSSDSLTPVADAYINAGDANRNYGASNPIVLDGSSSSATRLLARFDLSGIAPGTLLTSATLRFFVTSISNRESAVKPVQVFNVTEAWVEGTLAGGTPANGATWRKKDGTLDWAGGTGGSHSPTPAATLNIASTFISGWFELDLRALAQQWVDGVTPNHGVIVTLSSNEALQINSRENGTNRPLLVVAW